jgi:hypothetical protein
LVLDQTGQAEVIDVKMGDEDATNILDGTAVSFRNARRALKAPGKLPPVSKRSIPFRSTRHRY